MAHIGLEIAGDLTRFTVLDPAGRVLEDAVVATTEADFRRRFAALSPSSIAAQFDSAHAALFTLLSAMGHKLFFSGPLPHHLVPLFEQEGRRLGAVLPPFVLRQNSDRVGFAVILEPGAAWYAIGPMPPGTSFDHDDFHGFAPGAPLGSAEQAAHLHILLSTPEQPLERTAAA